MAARNPSSFTLWVDEETFLSGRRIVETEIDRLYNDLEQILDAPQLIISAVFRPISNDGSPADTEIGPWYVQNKDFADVVGGASTIDIAWSGLCWCDAGAATGILSVGASTRGFSSETPAWTTLQTTAFDTNAADIEINPFLNLNAGTVNVDKVYCAAFVSYAAQT